jgi:PAS domain S-box-containing protein
MTRPKAGNMPARRPIPDAALDEPTAANLVAELEAQARALSQANRELADREARLRALFDAEPDGVALVARDGSFLDLNHTGLRLLEADDFARLTGLRFESFATDPERTACRSLAGNVLRGHPVTRELEIVGLRGTRRWIEAHATPLLGEDGLVAAFVCVARDVTARKASEAALRDSEARLRGIFDSPMVGIVFWDSTGGIIDANDAFLQVVGYRREDVAAGRVSWIDITPDEFRELDQRNLETLARTGVLAPFEKAFIRRDGTRVPVVIGAAMLDPVARTGVAFIQDHTARKRAEEQLRESEERFRNLAENSPYILWVTDPDGMCTYVNQTWYDFSGQPPDGGLGAGFFTALHPEDAAAGEQAYRDTVRRRARWEHEYRVRRRDGVYRTMHDVGSPRFGPNGEFLGYVGILQDIQDRKDAETARQRLEAPLRQAQKMEALGTLAGGVAHDFNNILGTIIGNVELAREDLDPEHPAQESLSEVAKASARARDLVQQILTFSRRTPDERRVTALRDVVQESVRLLRATLPAGVEIVAEIEAGVPCVLADRSRIHQVLMNLCTNAWQAIDGLGRITVSLASVRITDEPLVPPVAGLAPGPYACLMVADTGRGIDAAIADRIFDPFFTTKAPGEGTGLGLSVVDGIVKSHDGAITVDSTAGDGATFRIFLPAVDGAVAPADAAPAAAPRGRGQRILYVDDEAALVQLATRLLGRLGYEVEGFTRPADALIAFAADPARYDMVISDMNMPTASGLSVAADVLRIRPNVPVALISGFVTEELTERAEALGVRGVIYKPNLTRDLGATIARLLG